MLFTEQEIGPHAAYLDQVSVVQFGQAVDFNSVDFRHEVPTAQVVAVLVLVDLRCNIRREPSAEPHRSHFRVTDHCELSREPVFLLVRASAKDDERWNTQ